MYAIICKATAYYCGSSCTFPLLFWNNSLEVKVKVFATILHTDSSCLSNFDETISQYFI